MRLIAVPPIFCLVMLVVIVVLSFWSARRVTRRSPGYDPFPDPVVGRWIWQGDGDGDYWRAELRTVAGVVALLIDGGAGPDPQLIARAHELASGYAALSRSLAALLAREARARPDEAAIIERLVVTTIALFPLDRRHAPDGYSGEFVLLAPRDHPGTEQDADEWRCDLVDGTPANLRRWS